MTSTANPDSRADWRSIRELYTQFSDLVEQQKTLDKTKKRDRQRELTEVAGSLAKHLSRVLAHYDTAEHHFADDLFEIMSSVDQSFLPSSPADRFRALYTDARLDDYGDYSGGSRRRPKPFEAAVETCRRLIGVNELRKALRGLQTGAILGGSASYGRFFNVTGCPPGITKASDSDVLLVLSDYSQLPEIADRLRSIPGVDSKSIDELKRRLPVFLRLGEQQFPTIFSHKLNLWTSGHDPIYQGAGISGAYVTSLHVFSRDVFDYLILKDLPILRSSSKKDHFERMLLDFRDTDPIPEGPRAYNQKSFSGREFEGHNLERTEVNGSFLTRVQICLIKEDRYCPGLHQNLILPQFEVRWESDDVRLRLRVLSFRWKIIERLRYERRQRRFEEQNISLSHVRYHVFAPHVIRRANRE